MFLLNLDQKMRQLQKNTDPTELISEVTGEVVHWQFENHEALWAGENET